jgi:hypothetical protein
MTGAVVMSLPVALLAPSDEDCAELERLARCGDRCLEERAGIVLAYADSAEGNSGVAAERGLSVETVRKWRSRFTVSGTARRGKTSQVLALRAKISEP